ncbi:MAG TPA: class A beta-lactamase-related serine hydrolase, partial [Deltaproteobacteria bacterium]|nr:class A beta-lactamase-related serine hydrolase [Deltaproteobacteria bacterium]
NTNLNRIAGMRRFCRMPRVAMLILLMSLLMGCHTSKPGAQDSLDPFSAFLDEQIPHLMARYDIPGVCLAIVRDGAPVWSGAYGYADLGQKRKMTVDAVCRVESISKSVTAWGVMRLVEQGLIDLDEPAQIYLPAFRLPQSEHSGQQITVRRLLSGNAGLPLGTIGKSVEYAPQSPMPTLQVFLDREVQLLNEPGAGFMYSNVGFNLLELLIEEVAGQDFADFMAQQVLQPLGMAHSSFSWRPSFGARIPTGYELDGTPVPPYVYPAGAAGGLFATVGDIARFVCAGMIRSQIDHSVLMKESIAQIHTPQVEIPGLFGFVADQYGFGHFIETLADGRTAVWHGGQGHGWMTHFHAIPESGDGIVILTNSQRSWPFMAQVLTDWSRWLGIKPVKMGRITIAIKALWALIGILLLISLLKAYRLINGLLNGARKFEPFAPQYRFWRLLQFIFGLIILAALAWSVAQPYRFISSIFPQGVFWGGISLLAFSMINMITALFPAKKEIK